MQKRALTIRLIWLAMGASLLIPLALFVAASWINYRHTEDLAVERLERSLDIEQEEAQQSFTFIQHTLNDALALVDGLSPEEIRTRRPEIEQRLQALVADLPVLESVSIFDSQGNELAATSGAPPANEGVDVKDSIRAHSSGAEIHYGRPYLQRPGDRRFFSISRASVDNGAVESIVAISVPSGNFFRFYATMANSPGLQYGLVRNDGYILARYPQLGPEAPDRLGPTSGFRDLIGRDPEGGLYTAISVVDGVERRYAVRRLPGAPLYIQSGIATSAIRAEWIAYMAPHLIFGIPATILLFMTLFVVLRRTERLYAETDQRSLAEESLRQAQKMESIGQLTGGVAHDFNNLLTIIIGNLDMAKRQTAEWPDSSAQAKLAKHIESAVQGAARAASLTKRLLAFSRQQTLNPTLVDVNKLLAGLADFLQRAIGEEVSLEIVGSAGVWPVEVDQTELEAAILNLAVNARDAMPDGGKLTIEASNSYLDDAYSRRNSGVSSGQYVQISVTDTGAGMSRETIERAFDPFFTTKQTGQGTGLGLSQVYGFVKQSGGHVKIYSEIGEGTTIKVYLPRLVGSAHAAAEAIAPARAGRRGETILVTEDDADVRGYVMETLEGLGYTVLGAGAADEALGLIHDGGKIDLLLTDVIMPGANGRKLALEAQERRPSLKVLFMTGYSRNAIVHQGRLDAGVALLQKPLTSESLAAAVRKVLDT